jgi:hypothetical protein
LERFSDGGMGSKIAFQEAVYKKKYNSVLKTIRLAEQTDPTKYSALMEAYSDAW